MLEQDRGKNCIGKAIESGQFDTRDIDESGKGELVYYGKCAMLGYVIGADDLTSGHSSAGLVETGDIVNRDQDGFYFIVGRKKRIIKLNGRRVNLDDIENYIKSCLK